MKRAIVAVLSATVWISISEFVRNQLLFASFWRDHYSGLGLVFPERPVNGALWGLWSLLFAISIYLIARRFGFAETAFIAWLTGFLMMWVTIGNLGVLPFGLLWFAVPLSVLEVVVAVWIIRAVRTSGRDAAAA